MKVSVFCVATVLINLGFVSGACAQTGLISMTGTVPGQCSVITGGTAPAGGEFGNTVPLGVLVDGNGHLLTTLTNSGNVLGTQAFQLNCTGANNAVSLTASGLALNGQETQTTTPGYASVISYTAEADFAVAGGAPAVLTTPSNNLTTSSTLGVGNRLANAPDNIDLKAYGLNTPNTATDILVEGSYSGTITVTISPGS